MKRFIGSLVFALTISIGSVSFAQSEHLLLSIHHRKADIAGKR
jgi:hypothetical protein